MAVRVRQTATQRRKKYLRAAALAAAGFVAPCSSAYSQVVNYVYTGASQSFTASATGTYQITAYGAQGGRDIGGALGGNGAKVEGFFSLTAGDLLTIIVGGKGGDGTAGAYGGGGGGGSFVFTTASTTLLLAAGGGGGGYAGSTGGVGQTTQGTGAAGTGSLNPGGGGGSFSASASGTWGGKGFPSFAGGSKSFVNSGNGGFGGGGGGGGYGGGGGGGFSGGNSGAPSGGGFSFNAGTSPTATAGFRAGNGAVDIAFIPAAVPEPSPVALMASGFAAFAAYSAWSRRSV